jgi:hypothetical protein
LPSLSEKQNDSGSHDKKKRLTCFKKSKIDFLMFDQVHAVKNQLKTYDTIINTIKESTPSELEDVVIVENLCKSIRKQIMLF